MTVTRSFLSCMALSICLYCLPGCAPSGGEAEFKPSADRTAADLQAEEDYNAMVAGQTIGDGKAKPAAAAAKPGAVQVKLAQANSIIAARDTTACAAVGTKAMGKSIAQR